MTGDLAAVGLCREPLLTLACGKSPRSNPGCPGAARLKGRRFRPALPASLDFLSFSPKRVPQNCRSIEMFRATDREGPRAVAPCRASHTLRKCRTVTSFHCPGVADPADVVVRRTSQPPPGFLEAFASASSETCTCGIFIDTVTCLQNHPPSFTPSVPAHSNRSCSSFQKNILSWGCQRRLFIVFICGVHSRCRFPGTIGRKAADLSSCSAPEVSHPFGGLLLHRAVGLLHPTSDPEVFRVSPGCEPRIPAKRFLPFKGFPPNEATTGAGFPASTVGARQGVDLSIVDLHRVPCPRVLVCPPDVSIVWPR